MWKDLSDQWRTVFDEAWNAFKAGSTPIGAAIFDEDGRLILKDRNRAAEPQTLNRRISHAEANCLHALDTDKYQPKAVTLYTTMEPCPMCMGMAVMSNIFHLRYAAHDTYCGMVALKDNDSVPYIKNRGLDYTFAGEETELVQLTIQSCYELRCINGGKGSGVLQRFREQCPEAVDIANKLFAENLLDKLTERDAACAEVYDMIVTMRGKIG